MIETLLTVVFLVTGSEGALLRLEAAASGIAAAGDSAAIYRLDPAADERGTTWHQAGQGRIVDTGDGLAVVAAGVLGTGDWGALRVAVQVPAQRISADKAAADKAAAGTAAAVSPEAAYARVSALLADSRSDEIGDAAARAIPNDERVELAILALLQARWSAREIAAESPLDGGPPGNRSPGDGALGDLTPGDSDATPASDAPAALALGESRIDDSGLIPVRIENSSAEAALTDAQVAAEMAASLPREEVSGAGEDPPSVGITARVRQWAAARASGQLDAVLDFYAEGFTPADGSSRADWTEQQRAALGAGQLSVALDDLDAGFYGGIDRARVTFTERAQIDGVARPPQAVQLILVWERADWRILEESAVEAAGQS